MQTKLSEDLFLNAHEIEVHVMTVVAIFSDGKHFYLKHGMDCILPETLKQVRQNYYIDRRRSIKNNVKNQ